MPLHTYLRQKRLEAGLTQLDCAKLLGFSTAQFISNWERGVAKPPLKSVKKVAEIYNLDIAKFKKHLVGAYKEKLEGIL